MSTETINTHEESGESAEHFEEMVAKGEELERRNNPDQEQRPDWLPEKFKNAEQMAEAYSNLEKKLGSGEQEQQEEPQEEYVEEQTEEVPDTEAEQSQVREAVEAAGVDFNSLQGEYDETGELSEQSYNALAEAGFPQDLVNLSLIHI